jgi:hypothetical protein
MVFSNFSDDEEVLLVLYEKHWLSIMDKHNKQTVEILKKMGYIPNIKEN